MPYTVQQVLDIARAPLNDAAKSRYSDNQLLSYYNTAIFRTLELRPDLRILNYGSDYVPITSASLSSTVPISDRYAQTLADYIGARAEMRDDEAVNAGRAQTLMQMFVSELIA